MVDHKLFARSLADIRSALARIRSKLPSTRHAFLEDQDARDIVVLNLFVALQHTIALATHWLAELGLDVPERSAEVFRALAKHQILDAELAERLASAAGLRDLIAHRYGMLDWERIYEIAATELDDLDLYSQALARAVDDAGSP